MLYDSKVCAARSSFRYSPTLAVLVGMVATLAVFARANIKLHRGGNKPAVLAPYFSLILSVLDVDTRGSYDAVASAW